VYILYHVVLCIHSLTEWDILMLGGQLSFHILYTVSIYLQFLVSKSFSKSNYTNCLVLSCHYGAFCFSLNVSELQPSVTLVFIYRSFIQATWKLSMQLFAPHPSFRFRDIVSFFCLVSLQRHFLKFVAVWAVVNVVMNRRVLDSRSYLAISLLLLNYFYVRKY
jgi:hypothetical protein